MIRILSFLMSAIIFIMSLFGVDVKMRGFKLDVTKLSQNVTASQTKRIVSGTLAGSQVVVEQDGEVVFEEIFGARNLAGDNLEADAVYRIASMTKPITAVALLLEYERGNIDIYADLSDYLPSYKNMKVISETDKSGNITDTVDAKNPIKVYQLVSHTSGLGSGTILESEWSGFIRSREGVTLTDVAELFSELPLSFDPGTKQEYSTVAFDIAAKLIEDVSGLEYGEYLKKNIFEPLGMKDTTFTPTEEQYSRMVSIHSVDSLGKPSELETAEGCVFGNIPDTYPAAGAGLASTASDYSLFASMLLNGGVGRNGERILKETSVKLMATPVPEMDNIMGKSASWKWGLAVRVITGNNTLPVGSFGWSGAYGTHFWIDPVNRIAAVYMKNSTLGGAGCDTANEFEKDVMNSFKAEFISKK